MNKKDELEITLNKFIKQKEKEGKILDLSDPNLDEYALTNDEIIYYTKEKDRKETRVIDLSPNELN